MGNNVRKDAFYFACVNTINEKERTRSMKFRIWSFNCPIQKNFKNSKEYGILSCTTKTSKLTKEIELFSEKRCAVNRYESL